MTGRLGGTGRAARGGWIRYEHLALLLPVAAGVFGSTEPTSAAMRAGIVFEEHELVRSAHEGGRRTSADGRWVVFATDLALDPGDTNGVRDVYLADRLRGRTVWVSCGGDAPSLDPSLTGDGGLVAFWSYSDNLVRGDSNGLADVFLTQVRGGTVGETALVSTDRHGGDAVSDGADGHSMAPSVSDDGRWVSFRSLASDLVPHDSNLHTSDVFLAGVAATDHGLAVRSMTLVSTDGFTPWTGDGANGPSYGARIDRRATEVRFTSQAGDLVTGDRNGIGSDRFVAHLTQEQGMPRVAGIDLVTRAGAPGRPAPR